MFLGNKKRAYVVSKQTGKRFTVRLQAKSSVDHNRDIFIIAGGNTVYRSSLQRRYVEA